MKKPRIGLRYSPDRRPLCSIALLASLLAVPAQAQYAALEIDTSERQLVFELPREVALADGDTLAVELDGYDVTAFSRVQGRTLYLELETPLDSGAHGLNLLLLLANGDIESLLDQQIQVGVGAQDYGQWQANSTFNSGYRFKSKEKPDYQFAPHLAGNGGLSVRGLQQSGAWQLQLETDLLYDSVSQTNIDDDEWALPHYRLGLSYQSEQTAVGVTAGNVLIEREDLLFSYFQRRGVSADVRTSDAFQFTAFGLQSEPLTRYDGDLLAGDSGEDRAIGMTTTVSLWEEYLQLSAGYLDGETRLAGAGLSVFEDTPIYGGDSWNVALDSRTLQRSLWMRMEYAESEFDSDGIDMGVEAERDDAAQAMLQFSSDGALGRGPFDYWSAWLQYQKVGRDYYSLGNLSLPGDLELVRSFIQGGRGGLAANLEWSEEQNNIDDEIFLPTQTMQRAGGNLQYTPTFIDPQAWLWRTVGSPSLGLNYYQSTHDQPTEDAFVSGYDLDRASDESGVTLSFAREMWNWSVQYQQIDIDDRSEEVIQDGWLLYEPSSDTRNELTGLQLGWMPTNTLSLSVYMQWNTLEEVDADNTYNNRNYGVDAYWQLWPQTLTLLLNYSQGQNSSRLSNSYFLEDDAISHFGNAQLSWHALPAAGNMPGIDLYVKGSYGMQDNRTFELVDEQWAALVGVEIHWNAGVY